MRNRPEGGCRGRSLTAQGRSAILFHALMFIPIVVLVGSIVHQRHFSLPQSFQFFFPSHLPNPNSSSFQPLLPHCHKIASKWSYVFVTFLPILSQLITLPRKQKNANPTRSSKLRSPLSRQPPNAATEGCVHGTASCSSLFLRPAKHGIT